MVILLSKSFIRKLRMKDYPYKTFVEKLKSIKFFLTAQIIPA